MKGLPYSSDGKESACNAGDLGSFLGLGRSSGEGPKAVLVLKNLTANAGDKGSSPGSGRSPEGGNGKPFQSSCLENPRGQKSLVGYSP